MQQVLAMPKIRGRIEEQGADVVASGSERCRRFLDAGANERGRLVRDNNTALDS